MAERPGKEQGPKREGNPKQPGQKGKGVGRPGYMGDFMESMGIDGDSPESLGGILQAKREHNPTNFFQDPKIVRGVKTDYVPWWEEKLNEEREEAAPVIQKKAANDDGLEKAAAEIKPKVPLIVEDSGDAEPSQMTKTAFLNTLQSEICTAVDAELAGLPFDSGSCPYIRRAFQRHRKSTPDQILEVLGRYAPDTAQATTAQGLVAAVVAKVKTAAGNWAKNGDLTGLPEEVVAEMPASVKTLGRFNVAFRALSGASGAVREGARMLGGSLANMASKAASFFLFKSNPGGPRPPETGITGRLGDGKPLESGYRNRMEGAMGGGLDDVRVYSGAGASELSRSMNAKAFTVGSNVVVDDAHYNPGSPEGDLLMAHELAHVRQQKSGATEGGNTAALESDADRSAAQAVLNPEAKGAARPAGRTFPRFQGCSADEPPKAISLLKYNTQFYGDPFEISLNWWPEGKGRKVDTMEFHVKYTGDGQPSKVEFGREVSVVGANGEIPNPTVLADANGKVTISLTGTADSVITFESKELRYDYGWSPPSRVHNIYMRQATAGMITKWSEPDLIIKSKDAVPAKDKAIQEEAAKATIPPATGVRTFNPEVGLVLNMSRIDALMGMKALGDAEKASLKALREELATAHAAIGKGGGDMDKLSPKLLNLEDSLEACGIVIGNLEPMMEESGYLQDISKDAVGEVRATASFFAYAITNSYSSKDQANVFYSRGTLSLKTLPYRISALYLKGGAAIDNLLNQTILLRQQLQYFRNMNGRGANTRPLDGYLEIGTTGMMKVVHSKADAAMATERRNLHEAFFKGTDAKVLEKVYALAKQSQKAVALYSMLTLHEQFKYFYKELGGVIDTVITLGGRDYEQVALDYTKKFDGFLTEVEKGMAPGATGGESLIEAAITKFNKLVSDPQFTADVKGIQGRLKTIAVVDMVAKVVVIVAAAALTAGAAGAAAGAALEGAGVTGLAFTGAVAFSEALAFTFVSRIGNQLLLGGNTTSFLEDLGTNWAMFFVLRTVANIYAKIAERLKIDPKSFKFKLGQFGTSFATLQAFAVAHHLIKEKKMMTLEQFFQSLGMNAVLMAALHMGRFITEPLNNRISARVRQVFTDKFSADLKVVEAMRTELKPEMELLNSGKATQAQVESTTAKIKQLFEMETALVNKAAAVEGKTGKEYTAILQKYAQNIVEADAMLSKPVVDAQGKQKSIFRQIKGDTVAYQEGAKTEAIEMLGKFYAEVGGKFEMDATFGVGRGSAGAETLFFVPEGLANKGGLVGWAQSRGGSSSQKLEFISGRLSPRAQEGLKIFTTRGEKAERTMERLKEIEQSGKDVERHLEGLAPEAVPAGATWDSANQKTDPSTYLKSGETFVKDMVKGMHPSKILEISQIADLAVKGDLRFELILRVLDPLYNGAAFKAAMGADKTEPGIFDRYNVHYREKLMNILRDPTLDLTVRKAELAKVIAQMEAEVNASKAIGDKGVFRFAEAKTAAEALSTQNFGNQIRVDAGGKLFRGAKEMGTFRQLIDQVVATNKQMQAAKVNREVVISIGEPGPSGNREVFLLTRPLSDPAQPRATSPVKSLATAGKPDGVVLDIGSGTSAFALELVPVDGTSPIVQTEYGKVSFDPGLGRRDLGPHLNSIPRHNANSVAVFGDPMQTMSLLYGPNSVRFVVINNVNAKYSKSQYEGLAKNLLEVMQEGGRVEVQWDSRPERPGGAKNDRGHIMKDELLNALNAMNQKGRSFTVEDSKSPIVDYDYSIEPSRYKGGPKGPTDVTPPKPTDRWIFTFGPFK